MWKVWSLKKYLWLSVNFNQFINHKGITMRTISVRQFNQEADRRYRESVERMSFFILLFPQPIKDYLVGNHFFYKLLS